MGLRRGRASGTRIVCSRTLCELLPVPGERAGMSVDKPLSRVYFAIKSEFHMNDLNRALGDISSIRRQMARSTEFHGYGPATLAGTRSEERRVGKEGRSRWS